MIFKPVSEYLEQLAIALREYLKGETVNMLGIHRGGVWVAEHLHQALENSVALGQLDISFYRDDFSRVGLNPEVKPSNIPFEIEGQHIVLVDDIIQTGRTIRAAMNEIFDYARPKTITLACIFAVDGRELPIRPDVVVEKISLQSNQRIKLQGPYDLTMELCAL